MGGGLALAMMMSAAALAADEWDVDLGQLTAMGTGVFGQDYGEVLATGDLNGDGMDDIVVSAPGAASGVGEVSVIFGSVGGGDQDEADVRNWWLRGASGDEIGDALLVADIDDDGSQDLIVGNPRVGSSTIGEVWVFRGPLADAPTTVNLRADADMIIQGSSGTRLGGALDYHVNTSGDRLLAVGATRTSGNDGGVHVIDADLVSTGTQAVTAVELRSYTGTSNEQLGYSVAFTDFGLAVSAPLHEDGSGNPVGRVRWFGFTGTGSLPSSGTAALQADATATGAGSVRKLGLQVANLKRANDATGLQHLLGIIAEEGAGGGTIGDTFFWKTEASKPDLDADTATLASMSSNDSTASGGHDEPKRLAWLGDLNGDGLDEFAYSDANVDELGVNEGAVYVIAGIAGRFELGEHGSENARARVAIYNRGATGERLGNALATGDLNGDGRRDIVAGWPRYSGLSADQGAIRSWYGPFRPSTGGSAESIDLDARMVGTADGAFLGANVEGIGDFNCDGVDDVAFDSPFTKGGSLTTVPGEVFIAYGPTDEHAKVTWDPTDAVAAWYTHGTRIQGVSHGDTFGWAHGVGDLDGDGCDDLVVGATGVDSGGSSAAGAAYLFYGDPSHAVSQSASAADATFALTAAGAALGSDVIALEDLDGDGKPELVLAATGEDHGTGADTGVAYLYKTPSGSSRFSGNYAPRTDADCIIEGSTSAGRFTVDMVSADLDNDGTRDLVIGASDDGDGKIYVWTEWPCGAGSSTTSSAADIRIDARYGGGDFGWSLARVGPLEVGDTTVEGIAVSAPSGTDSRVAVIPGNQTAGTHTSPAGGFEICGPDGATQFGYALASGNMTWEVDAAGTGEVWDKDGALELFIGAPQSIAGAVDEGRAFGFEGHELAGLPGTTPPTCALSAPADAWFSVEGDGAYDWLGSGLTTADLNRDGFDDVIIGESGQDIPPPSGPATGANRGQISIGLSTQDIP